MPTLRTPDLHAGNPSEMDLFVTALRTDTKASRADSPIPAATLSTPTSSGTSCRSPLALASLTALTLRSLGCHGFLLSKTVSYFFTIQS